jgi:hypothetical protein
MTPTYFDAVPRREMLREYPLGAELLERFKTLSRDALRHLQNQRFLTVMRRGWEIPFYRRLWSAKGIELHPSQRLPDPSPATSPSRVAVRRTRARAPAHRTRRTSSPR